MSRPNTSRTSTLDEARHRAGRIVVSFMDDLIARVEEAASAATYQRGIFATETERTIDVNVGDVSYAASANDLQDTPTISNAKNPPEELNNKNERPTKRLINMPDPQPAETMTEELSDFMFQLGYDSDGELPFFGNADEERQMMEQYEEGTLGNEPSLTSADDTTTSTTNTTSAPTFIFIPYEEIKKMKVDELKQELKKRGVSMHGKKAELQERLTEAIRNKIAVVPVSTRVLVADPKNFPPTAYWRTLQPTGQVEDPTSDSGSQFHGPTEDPETRRLQPKKRNFDDIFDRPVFTGTSKVPIFSKFKRRKLNPQTKKPESEVKTVGKKGVPKQDFLDQHNLSHESAPHKFFEAFVPYSMTAKWNSYTTIRAQQENAGELGGPNGLYPDWKPFTIKELRQHIGVRMLHGIAPTPQLAMKFKSQTDDVVNGNDFVHRCLGPNATRRHKHFRRFFAVQNPVLHVPPRSTDPNWKIREWLDFVQSTSIEAWMCGFEISVDEQTLKFQGHHIDKLRISYKREGDGFQCDALCNDGYTFAFYFRNEPPPKKYTDQGLSPLHARVMALFDKLDATLYRCGMDNLYNSARFCKHAYNHPSKILIHGVARRNGRGIPSSVLQDEVQNRNEQGKVRGTVKAAELVGDPKCPGLVAVSIYDTKPVHFLSMRCENIKWVEKTRLVYDKNKGKTIRLKFLRLNVTEDYNYGMGHVDMADQLRNYYRMDHWLRNFKWWHSIFWWGLQVLLVNSYVVYCRVMEQAEAKPVSHYEYHKACALAWIDPGGYGDEGSSFKTPSDNEQEMSTLSSVSSTNRKARFSDSALDPRSGSLKNRLNRNVHHWPCTPIKDKNRNTPVCQLHRWAAGVQKRSNSAYCPECNVHLCLDCYQPFHCVYELVAEKDSFRRKFQSENGKK